MPTPIMLALLATTAPAATALTTDAPLDTVVQCLRTRLEPNGRITAINTAAGVMLDYAFDAVGADGRVSPSRIAFTIEDRGTERGISVSATNAADAPLALQYLRQDGARCAGGDAKVAAHGAP